MYRNKSIIALISLLLLVTATFAFGAKKVVISFEKHPKAPSFPLRGSWAKYFPKDFDLDEELKQIRREWEKEMEVFVKGKGKQVKKTYFFYTTCPKCAKFYGKNYMVAVSEIQ